MSCPNKNFLYHVSKLRCVRIRVSVSMLHINKPILSLCLQDKDTSGFALNISMVLQLKPLIFCTKNNFIKLRTCLYLN